MCINCIKCGNCNSTPSCSVCSLKTFEEVIPVDADNVYYQPKNNLPSKLESIGVGNGRSVKYALEQIVKQLNFSDGIGFSLYNLDCFQDCEIETIEEFAELVASELCLIKQNLQTLNTSVNQFSSILTRLTQLEIPDIKEGKVLGILKGDTLVEILDKLISKYETLPQYQQVYYKFDIINSGTLATSVSYTNGANQLQTISIAPVTTTTIENVKSILTSANLTLTFIFKGI